MNLYDDLQILIIHDINKNIIQQGFYIIVFAFEKEEKENFLKKSVNVQKYQILTFWKNNKLFSIS